MILHGNSPYPPLPGAGRPPRGLFVGRSAALLEVANRAAGPKLPKASCPAETLRMLFRAGQRGWNLYLIGNEERVARGRVSDETWGAFETELLAMLRGQGIPVVRHYACLDHPRGKGRHRRDSVFRFPNTGALFHACQEDGIELRESWVIAGDEDELVAGWRAGCRTARLQNGPEPLARGPAGRTGPQVEPDFVAENLARALAELLASDEYSRA